MVVATTASEGLRHGSVSGTLGFAERIRTAGEGDFSFDYRGVAVANMGLVNVCGRSRASVLTYRAHRAATSLSALLIATDFRTELKQAEDGADKDQSGVAHQKEGGKVR